MKDSQRPIYFALAVFILMAAWWTYRAIGCQRKGGTPIWNDGSGIVCLAPGIVLP